MKTIFVISGNCYSRRPLYIENIQTKDMSVITALSELSSLKACLNTVSLYYMKCNECAVEFCDSCINFKILERKFDQHTPVYSYPCNGFSS